MLEQGQLTEEVIGAAIEVHRELGPGLLESAYEECLCHELHLRGLRFQRQRRSYSHIRDLAENESAC
jgi:GxxExxY protein